MFGQTTPSKNAFHAFFLLLGALGFKLLVELLAIIPFFDPDSLTILEIPSYLLFWVTVASIVPILFYVQQRNKQKEKPILMSEFLDWKYLPAKFLLGLVLFGVGVIFVNSGLELSWPESSYLDKNSLAGFEQFVIINGWVDGVFKLMTIVFAAAVVEELLFRTFFISALQNWIGSSGAIIISAMLFTVIHTQYFAINPLLLVNVFILAVALGFVRIFSGSVIPAVILHAINNGISFLILNLEQIDSTAFGINELSAQFWFFVGIILVLVSWMFLGNEMKYPIREQNYSTTEGN